MSVLIIAACTTEAEKNALLDNIIRKPSDTLPTSLVCAVVQDSDAFSRSLARAVAELRDANNIELGKIQRACVDNIIEKPGPLIVFQFPRLAGASTLTGLLLAAARNAAGEENCTLYCTGGNHYDYENRTAREFARRTWRSGVVWNN